MIKPNGFFTLLFLGLSFAGESFSQAPADSLFYTRAINTIKSVYFSTIKEKAQLYTGYEYEYFGRGASGSPFFIVDTMHKGEVFYDGILYEDVPLRYDLVNDELLVKYLKDNNTIRLLKNRVDYFSILGHQFIRLNEGEHSSDETAAFYELLYQDKKMFVLAKRTKKHMLSSNPEDGSAAFVQYNQYFVYNDEKFASVSSDNDLVEIFKDKAQEVKKFIRTEQLKYKKDPEQVIVKTAAFYTGLTK